MRRSYLFEGLYCEARQLRDEGRNVPESFDKAVKECLEIADIEEKNKKALELYEYGRNLPEGEQAKLEPNALEEIRALAKGNALPAYDSEKLFDKCYGGWLARAAGCLLGKPVEGWRTPEMHKYLKGTNNYPITDYITSKATESVKEELLKVNAYAFEENRAFIDRVECMPEDDDTNYTVLGLKLLEKCGRDFKNEDVADMWLDSLPYHHLFTAEDITYRNLLMLKPVGETAVFCNGYREWIGAQIRADAYGYVNPGDPRAAAEMAWRDASISHVKNGIYGEMWVAAMIASAYVLDDIVSIIRAGLNETPADSRLNKAVERIIEMYENGTDCETVCKDIAERWDEYDPFDWCHTISNAEIVTMALLYGAGDLEKTISLAVMQGFDTDCNAATAASVLGVLLGSKKLPEKWIAPLNDRIITGVHGYNDVKISDMAARCLKFVK